MLQLAGLIVMAGALLTTVPVKAETLPFHPGEQVRLSVQFLGINAGELEVQVGQRHTDSLHLWTLEAEARTRGLTSVMWKIDEQFTSLFDPAAAAAIGSDRISRVNGDDQTEVIRIEGETAHVTRVREGKKSEKTREVLPGSQDILAAVYRLRTMDLKPLDEVSIPIFTGNKSWKLEGKVIGRQVVKSKGGTYDTLVIRCRTHFDGKFASDRDLTVWLSDDARRIPVRLEADFLVGSMRATLQEYRPGMLARK